VGVAATLFRWRRAWRLSFFIVALLCGCASVPRYRIVKRTDLSPAVQKEIEEEAKDNDDLTDPRSVLPSITSSTSECGFDRDRMLGDIKDMLGTPYSYSGTNLDGIDCSGFTSLIYEKSAGMALPHSTAEQYQMSKPVPEGGGAFGDLIFFNTTGESPSHVGIYLGKGYFAHASVSSGVTISSLESTYYKKRYLDIRRYCK
jgi:hypothetical protein